MRLGLFCHCQDFLLTVSWNDLMDSRFRSTMYHLSKEHSCSYFLGPDVARLSLLHLSSREIVRLRKAMCWFHLHEISVHVPRDLRIEAVLTTFVSDHMC